MSTMTTLRMDPLRPISNNGQEPTQRRIGLTPEVDFVNPDLKTNMNMLDANVYATKKTIAQGMLDVALLTANASQLKYLLQLGSKDQPFFYMMVTLISMSIVLQILVGALFVTVGYIDFNDQQKQRNLNVLNNIATISVFLITMVNILIAGFGFNVPSY